MASQFRSWPPAMSTAPPVAVVLDTPRLGWPVWNRSEKPAWLDRAAGPRALRRKNSIWEETLRAWGVPPENLNDLSALADPEGVGPRLFFQRVPEGKQAKNRVHLDVHAAPGLEGDARMAVLEAEAERLVSHGATRVRRYEPDPPLAGGYIVMTDPEGNEFCLD